MISSNTTVETRTSQNSAYFGNGAFNFVRNEVERNLYKNMHNAITATESWNWLRNYTPEDGFSMSTHPQLTKIQNKMLEDPISGHHSGCSYACMMRNMEYIAKNGYETFKTLYSKPEEARTPLYPPAPPSHEQREESG